MSEPQVAPFIMEAVGGNLACPQKGLPITHTNLDALPGKLGWVHGIINGLGWLQRGRDHLLEQRRYGPIYKHQVLGIPMVFVSDPELIPGIVRNEGERFSAVLAWRVLFQSPDGSCNDLDGPLPVDFEAHMIIRRAMQGAFSLEALTAFIEHAQPLYEAAIDRWCQTGRVLFKAEIRHLFADVACRGFLGIEDQRLVRVLDQAFGDYWRAPLAAIRNEWLSLHWRRAKQGYQTLCSTLASKVAERRRGNGSDMFSRMCRMSNEGGLISDEILVRVVVGAIAAGFETGASSLASMGYELARRPELQERLRAEARRIEGRPSLQQLRTLESIDWTWRETLRRYPVNAGNPRRALRDIKLGSYDIPAGTIVFPLTSVAMNDAGGWTAPERFDPDRFSPARAEDKGPRACYLPFGAGAHVCIGAQLASFEARAFWHAMLSRCRFELRRPYQGVHRFSSLGAVSGPVELALTRLT